MDKNSFNFELESKEIPFDVIKEAISIIDIASRNYVSANIVEYNGNIDSYIRRSSAASMAEVMNSKKEIDIQTDLGEIDYQEFKYEVYLTVKGLDNYKYRMFFVRYGSISYPVTVVLNRDIAEKSLGKTQTKYFISNEDNLRDMLNEIINSSYIYSIVQSLINEALRRENKDN